MEGEGRSGVERPGSGRPEAVEPVCGVFAAGRGVGPLNGPTIPEVTSTATNVAARSPFSPLAPAGGSSAGGTFSRQCPSN